MTSKLPIVILEKPEIEQLIKIAIREHELRVVIFFWNHWLALVGQNLARNTNYYQQITSASFFFACQQLIESRGSRNY